MKTKTNIIKHKLSRVVVFESLEDEEVKTGKEAYNLINGIFTENSIDIPIDHFRLENAKDFKSKISSLTKIASTNDVPLIHIDCHGDIKDGLIFENGSSIEWRELAELIIPINQATNFQLIVCISACCAAEFLGQMGTILRPCPCRLLVAPETMINAADSLSGFRRFYSKLFSTFSWGDAIDSLKELNTVEVTWTGEFAESWFARLTQFHVLQNWSRQGIKARSAKIKKQAATLGTIISNKEAKKMTLRYARNEEFNSIYTSYFGIEENPEANEIFEYLNIEFKQWVNKMSAQNKCIINYQNI